MAIPTPETVITKLLELLFKVISGEIPGAGRPPTPREVGEVARAAAQDIAKGRIRVSTRDRLIRILKFMIGQQTRFQVSLLPTALEILGPGVFTLTSSNPGHGFLVRFTPFFFGGAGGGRPGVLADMRTEQQKRDRHQQFHFDMPSSAEHEAFHREGIPPAGLFLRDLAGSAFEFLEFVAEAGEDPRGTFEDVLRPPGVFAEG